MDSHAGGQGTPAKDPSPSKKRMRLAPNSLRIHFALLTAVLLLYAGIGTAYVLQGRALDAIDKTFQRETAVLVRLTKLRAQLRALSLLTETFLLTGREAALSGRGEVLARIGKTLAEMEPLAARDNGGHARMRRELDAYLRRSADWIERRRAGRIDRESGVELASARDRTDAMIDLLTDAEHARVEAIQTRRDRMRRASTRALFLVGIGGLCVLLVLLWLLSAFVTRPLARLAANARSWSLGATWPELMPTASLEIRMVDDRLREMIDRLGGRLAAERSLAEFRRQLVSTVAHEVNNALTVISAAAAIVQESHRGGQATVHTSDQYLDMIRANVRSLSVEMSNLLELGKGESGRFEIVRKRVNCARLARDVVERLRLLAERKGLRIEEIFPPGLPEAAADPAALSLVVTNLLGNAIKYTPAGGLVEVGARSEGESVRLHVRDTGIGIDAKDKERILSGYYRTEQGQLAAHGFGIGLRLAQSLLEADGSKIAIDSEPGKGSTFSFLLPACKPGDI